MTLALWLILALWSPDIIPAPDEPPPQKPRPVLIQNTQSQPAGKGNYILDSRGEQMSDVVVTVPKNFRCCGKVGLAAWIAEGDAAGEKWSGEEWHFYGKESNPIFSGRMDVNHVLR